MISLNDGAHVSVCLFLYPSNLLRNEHALEISCAYLCIGFVTSRERKAWTNPAHEETWKHG